MKTQKEFKNSSFPLLPKNETFFQISGKQYQQQTNMQHQIYIQKLKQLIFPVKVNLQKKQYNLIYRMQYNGIIYVTEQGHLLWVRGLLGIKLHPEVYLQFPRKEMHIES